jgi:hypothetical protein
MVLSVIDWVLSRPKVSFRSASNAGWDRLVFRDEVVATQIFVDVALYKENTDASWLGASYIWVDGEGVKRVFTRSNHDNKGLEIHYSRVHLELNLGACQGEPETNSVLEGVLRLQPSGNRRLLWGKKFIDIPLRVPYQEGRTMDHVFSST